MKASCRPRPAIASPLSMEFPASAASVVRPQIASIRYSGGPSASAALRISGMSRTSTKMPTVEPSAEEDAAQPIAVRAWPALVIGYPSSMVAAFWALPGILKRMAVTEPMNVAPPTNAPNSNINGSGSHVMVRGMASAMRLELFRPGLDAKTIANSVPASG